MQLENAACDFCGSISNKLLYSLPDTRFCISSQAFQVSKCRHCSLVFVNPRPSERDLSSFYPPSFYQEDKNPLEAYQNARPMLEAKHRKVAHLQPGRLLDIGCYKGDFMLYMREKGWRVKGFEWITRPPNPYGLDISYGQSPAQVFPADSFDLITLWAVLEHVPAPRRMLEDVASMLRPGGRIICLVTNFRSIPGRFMRHDDLPRHLTMFTPSTLKRLIRLCGLHPVRFYFDNEVYSGSNRGFLLFLFKRLWGEPFEDILIQQRHADRWHEFTGWANGKPNKLMTYVNRLDLRLTPLLDRLAESLGFNFIMTVEARKGPGQEIAPGSRTRTNLAEKRHS